ncbi:MAG: zf-TFIIB domain-containing protein [Candidatus Staskawiczbacteria bacterium]|nr:zf-TFIIB domain-containing protein [Candidatus Staskawiczbacteria bacterium]
MNCPVDKEKLEKVLFHDVEVDYCPKCLGMWFDKDELRLAKDKKDENLNWLDFDLWRDKLKFEISPSLRQCPVCRAGLVEVAYDKSKTKVDFCKMCQGIWLDRGEFKQIINYLKNKSDYEILHHYTKNLVLELWEVFSGPEKFREELEDFLTLLKLLNYKFIAQHPHLSGLMSEDLPK